VPPPLENIARPSGRLFVTDSTGAGIGGPIDAGRMRHAYRRPDGSLSPSVEWSPLLSGDAEGVRVTFRF
jgi:hypothetical protein